MTFTLTLKRSEVSGHAGAIHVAGFQPFAGRDGVPYFGGASVIVAKAIWPTSV